MAKLRGFLILGVSSVFLFTPWAGLDQTARDVRSRHLGQNLINDHLANFPPRVGRNNVNTAEREQPDAAHLIHLDHGVQKYGALPAQTLGDLPTSCQYYAATTPSTDANFL